MADYPEGYVFNGGYPTPETIQRAYDDADLNRAVQCYRFFYPSVSIMATWQGNIDNGVVPNKVFPLLEGTPGNWSSRRTLTRPMRLRHWTSPMAPWWSSCLPVPSCARPTT